MRFWRWRRRAQEDRELDEELQFHLAEETRLRESRGEPPATARRSAIRDFGNLARTKEVAREAWAWSAAERLAQDLRFSLRMLRKAPAFTVLAVSALALGIGATTAVFDVVHSVLLRPLPFPNPERLVMVWETQPNTHKPNVVQTGNYLEWRRRNRSFSHMAALVRFAVNLEAGGEAVQVPGMIVAADFFETLGVRPLLGHAFQAEDDLPNGRRVAILSYGLWQRRFGGRADAIGSKIIAGTVATEVVGVMPPGYRMPAEAPADVYLTMRIQPGQAQLDGRNFSVVARLRPSVTLKDADGEMRRIAAETARERPKINYGWSATVTPLLERTVGRARLALLIVMGTAGLVLLIACANVANLLLMRGAARSREMNVRAALGAGRWRLLHQALTESALLALAAGSLGFLLAYFGVPAILNWLPAEFPLPRREEIGVDGAVFWFTAAVSLGCGLFFGLLPALQVDRSRLSEELRSGGRHGTSGGRSLRNLLVVAEVAMALLLVIGAGLMVRSFILLRHVDPGFQAEHLVTFRMVLMSSARDLPHILQQRAASVHEMLERIRALPQVRSASSIHFRPLSGGNSGTWYSRADRPPPPPAQGGGDVSIISDGYFRTMGIPLLAGREFEVRDGSAAPPVAVINQTLARTAFPGENPVGKRMRISWGTDHIVEIVGVAGDIHHNGLGTAPDPCLFMPQAQQPSGFATLVVRAAGDASVVAAVKEQIRQANPSQGVAEIQPMESIVAADTAEP